MAKTVSSEAHHMGFLKITVYLSHTVSEQVRKSPDTFFQLFLPTRNYSATEDCQREVTPDNSFCSPGRTHALLVV